MKSNQFSGVVIISLATVFVIQTLFFPEVEWHGIKNGLAFFIIFFLFFWIGITKFLEKNNAN